jgi:AcrR family transcriptional regulator
MDPIRRDSSPEVKERFRIDRQRELLATALRIVTTEGLSALTMPRLAEELDCGIGTLYRHVPTKDALIAELQREALDRILMSFEVSQAHLVDLFELRRVVDPRRMALAKAVAGVRFWICAEREMPKEIELLRLMFTDPDLHMEEEDISRSLPVSMRLLDVARTLVADAAEHGAIGPGPDVLRAINVVSGTNGVLMTSVLDRWDDLFNGQALATMLARDLFVGWGADPAELDEVELLVTELDAAGHLVPPIRR